MGELDHFDYADMLDRLDEDKLAGNPHRRRIVQQFISKCEQKMR